MQIGKRIMIIGSAGSGKSTFARELTKITKLPLTHLDIHFWNDGWVQSPKDEFYAWQAELIKDDEWIIDGNYGGSMELRLERVDTIINFKLSKLVCAASYLKRIVTGRKRADMPKGCGEYLDWGFLHYIWNFPKNSVVRNEEKIKRHPHVKLIEFATRRQSKKYLKELKNEL